MTIDVLFPFYGDVAMMKFAVQSILRQSATDWRLIVVVDGYPDDSIPGWFASLGDRRVTYVRNETNLGANGNYRKCLTFVESEVLVVMGAEDIMLPNYLEWLGATAEAHPDVDIFQPGVFVIDEKGAPSNTLVEKAKGNYRPRTNSPVVLRGEELAISVIRGDWLHFPSLGWRSTGVLELGFREGLHVVQDLALVLDIAKAGGALLYDPVAAFLYRRHSGSDSSVKALEGVRFDEERAFFEAMAAEMAALGWQTAARVARNHLSSRLHAATLLPRAVVRRRWSGASNLARHVVS